MFLFLSKAIAVSLGFVQRLLWLSEHVSSACENRAGGGKGWPAINCVLTMVEDLLRTCLAFFSADSQASYGSRMRSYCKSYLIGDLHIFSKIPIMGYKYAVNESSQ